MGSGKSDVHRGEAGLEGAFVGAEVYLWESCVGSALEVVKRRTFRSGVSSALSHHLGIASLNNNRELVKHAALELDNTTIFDVVVRNGESLLAQSFDVRASRVADATMCLKSERHEIDPPDAARLQVLPKLTFLFAVGDETWFSSVLEIAGGGKVTYCDVPVDALALNVDVPSVGGDVLLESSRPF